MLTQSRITSRPSVKVFNGLTPYRPATRWKREAGENPAGKCAKGGGVGGETGNAGPPFFYFGLSTSPEKIASLKRIRLGFHNGRVQSQYPSLQFSHPPDALPSRHVREDVRRRRGAYLGAPINFQSVPLYRFVSLPGQ